MTIGDDNSRMGKVFASAANGGGTITFRIALGAISGITLMLVSVIGNRMMDGQDALVKTQGRMATALATLAQQTSDTAKLASRNSERIDDHEHRITILEVRSDR